MKLTEGKYRTPKIAKGMFKITCKITSDVSII